MIKIHVRFGGPKGKVLWELEETPTLMAVRTRTRQPLDRVRFRKPAHRELLTMPCLYSARRAAVDVLEMSSTKRRDALRRTLVEEPDIQFAGRVLRSRESGAPVLYTENLFVKFRDSASEEECRRIIEKHGLRMARELRFAANAFFVKAPEGCGLKVFEYPDRLFSENAVELCHPEVVSEKSSRAAHPNQWHLKRTQIGGVDINQHAAVEEAWALSDGRGVTIAVIDDGFDLGHPEFSTAGKVVAPRDVTRGTDEPTPGPGDHHGTACAGVACASGVGNPGASGVAPGARLMPIRLASDLGSIEEAEAFYYAADSGADVISCSWGPPDGRWWDPNDPRHKAREPLPDATRLALDHCVTKGRGGKGCVITWAAGNGNESADNDGYAAYGKVIAVSASNDEGRKSDYSDFGKCVWCAFPSSQAGGGLTSGIWTTDRRGPAGYNSGQATLGDSRGNYTNDFGGTSSACPGVAGVAALVLSVNPGLRWDQVRDLLGKTAEKIDRKGGKYDKKGRSRWYGFGRVHAKRAVDAAIAAGGTPSVTAAVPKFAGSQDETASGPIMEVGGNVSWQVIQDLVALQRKQTELVENLVRIAARGAQTSELSARDGGAGTRVSRADDLMDPRVEVVSPLVRERIAVQAQNNNAAEGKVNRLLAGDEALLLEGDLNLTENVRRLLKADYTAISRQFGGSDVGPQAAANCKTVRDAVKLTHQMANKKGN